ncbi:MAG: calcium/sodium antiporter [Pseudomonadota bacterium]
MLLSCIFILIGLGLLVYGADVFVIGAASIARIMGMSSLMIGLTVVGFATSAPEMIVGSVAAWNEKTAIAVGNAIGSNITNVGLVLGVSIIVVPIVFSARHLKKEFMLMLCSIAIAIVLLLDNHLGRIDGAILLTAIILAMYAIVRIALNTKEDQAVTDEFDAEYANPDTPFKSIIKLLIGLTLLLIGAELLVSGATEIAREFGVSDLVIGLTIVAIGTSLPELAASIVSLLKKEADIAIGNIIGSNMFNMLAVLALPALIYPVNIESQVFSRDIPVMCGLTLLLAIMLFATKKQKLYRAEGVLLLACFITYQYFLYVQNVS